jgi:hypothetical protein
MKQIVSYGAGTNSTAMVCEMVRRGEPIDAIVFCDTGGERPETYAHVVEFNRWLGSKGYPQVLTIRRAPAKVFDSEAATLEEECLMRGQLPGIAYGFGSCSDKWKQQPFKTWLKTTGWTDVVVCIGFDADEPNRKIRSDKYALPYAKRFPLIEWDIGRDACVGIIVSAGVTPPGKSACFFCPSSRKHEILTLPPDLQKRALEIEARANLTSVAGLGRHFAWRDLIRADAAQYKMDFVGVEEVPCGCYDG